MKLYVLGSGSSGNCYVITNGKECLVIEAGVNIKHVSSLIDFDISIIDGVLCSHIHLDHSKFLNSFLKIGVNVFAGKDVLQSLDQTRSYLFNEVNHKKKFNVGNFKVMPLSLNHDVPCFGFLINHPETGSIFFATDTTHIPYRFTGVNHYLVECNYDVDIINTNETNSQLVDRVINSHLSLDNFISFMDAQDLSQTNNILLLHISENNSDLSKFYRSARYKYQSIVRIAYKGLKIDLNKEIF